MKYYQLGGYGREWNLYCSKEEVIRLDLEKHLKRNRKKWKSPELIQLYVDTSYQDHEQLDFNEPKLRNTMIWNSGRGSLKWHKAAFTPFIRGMCFSDPLYKILKNFKLTDEQYLQLEVKNYQKKTTHKYWFYYPIYNPMFTRLINFKDSIFLRKEIDTDIKTNNHQFTGWEDFNETTQKHFLDFAFLPQKISLIDRFDFCFDGYTYIVSERLRKAIEAAGMDDVYFYDLEYEVIVPDIM